MDIVTVLLAVVTALNSLAIIILATKSSNNSDPRTPQERYHDRVREIQREARNR